MRDHTSGANVEELLRQSQMELQWIQRQLAMIAARNIHHHHLHTKGKVPSHCRPALLQLLLQLRYNLLRRNESILNRI